MYVGQDMHLLLTTPIIVCWLQMGVSSLPSPCQVAYTALVDLSEMFASSHTYASVGLIPMVLGLCNYAWSTSAGPSIVSTCTVSIIMALLSLFAWKVPLCIGHLPWTSVVSSCTVYVSCT